MGETGNAMVSERDEMGNRMKSHGPGVRTGIYIWNSCMTDVSRPEHGGVRCPNGTNAASTYLRDRPRCKSLTHCPNAARRSRGVLTMPSGALWPS